MNELKDEERHWCCTYDNKYIISKYCLIVRQIIERKSYCPRGMCFQGWIALPFLQNQHAINCLLNQKKKQAIKI